MFRSDNRLRVIDHPNIGKTVISTKCMRRGDILWYWGVYGVIEADSDDASIYTIDVGACEDRDGYRRTIDGNGFDRSLLKYANMPGPGETSNIEPTEDNCVVVFGCLAARKFVCCMDIPKNQQIAWHYGKDYELSFEKYIDIALPGYPVPRCPTTAGVRKKVKCAPVDDHGGDD